MSDFKPSIVFLDEDSYTLSALTMQFRNTHHVFTATTVRDLFDVLSQEKIHVVIASQRLSEESGIDVLRNVRECFPNITRILLTGYADLANIIGNLEEGEIYRYLTKPWQPDELKRVVNRAAQLALEIEMSLSMNMGLVDVETDKILIIDDCEETHDIVSMQFTGAYELYWANNIDKAVDLLNTHEFGVIIADIKLNGVNIAPLIHTFKERMPLAATIMLTRFQDTDSLLELINEGKVYRCLPKPVRSSLLEMSVQRAFGKYRKLKATAEECNVSKTTINVSNDQATRIQNYLDNLKKHTVTEWNINHSLKN